MSLKEISLDGAKYIRADAAPSPAAQLNGLDYKIFRCDRSGVFAGYLKSISGQTAVILQARRIYYWEGAATLSQLAQSGTSKPQNCKFPEEVTEIMVTDCIEVLSVTKAAQELIASVKVWKA